MTHALEFMGNAVKFSGRGLVLAGKTVLVPAGAQVAVCSWCDGHRDTTQRLLRLGYSVTHGLCAACAAELEDGRRMVCRPAEIFG